MSITIHFPLHTPRPAPSKYLTFTEARAELGERLAALDFALKLARLEANERTKS